MNGEPGEDGSRPVILITGASAGLGRTLARELARRRPAATLILVARRLDRLDELAGELRASHPDLSVATIAADLADPEAPGRLAAEAIARFGGIDVLVNNAGLGLPTQFADADPGLIARQVAVNFAAPLMLARHCLSSLIERRGMIINISSAITCVPNSALGAYGATKAGLSYWNDALRRELMARGHDVRVCLVEPGPIRTEFMDAARSRLSPGEGVDPIVGNMRSWMTAEVDDAARRIARLLDHPRRRLSMLRRLVWPFRALGALARLCPPVGDWVVVRLTRRPIAPTTNAE